MGPIDHRTLEYPLRSRPNQIQNQSHSPPCLLPTTPLRNPPLANPSSTPPPLTCSPASPPSLATSLTKRRPSKLTTRPPPKPMPARQQSRPMGPDYGLAQGNCRQSHRQREPEAAGTRTELARSGPGGQGPAQ